MEAGKKEIMNKLAESFDDIESRRKMIELFGYENDTFSGQNADGEDVSISFDGEDGIILRTYQENGWVRINYYNKGGYSSGETYDGRWQTPSEKSQTEMKDCVDEKDRINILFEELVPLCEGDVKVVELFGDMENLKKEAEPFIEFSRRQGPKEERLAKIIFGLLENEAVRTADVPGIGTIDKSIADIIRLLNKTGHTTLASCSGVRADHDTDWEKKNGYISFSDIIENRSLAVNIADIDRYTPERGYTYLKQSFTLHFSEEQLPELICKLKKVCRVK